MTVHEALTEGRKQLEQASWNGFSVTTTPALDVSILLSHACNIPRTNLIAHPELSIDEWSSTFFSFLARRLTGEPVAYITQKKEFWGLEFFVSPAVLIPRADTEILVERALSILAQSTQHPQQVLDACTGSGCIAISIAASFKDCQVSAFDLSSEALVIAKKNNQKLLTPEQHVDFMKFDLRRGLPQCKTNPEGKYSLIVSNPPYVPSQVATDLLKDGRGEPILALDGGKDGLDLVRTLADHALNALMPGGTLLVETGEYHAKQAAEYLRKCGFTAIVIHTDLAGQERVIEGKKP